MGNNKTYKFKDISITSAKLPFNTQLFWEHATYGLILVDADDQTKLFISTDKGDNWAEIDLSDNANSYKIQSGWLDGNDLWLVMCDNDGTADDFEVSFIELDDSNDCNPIAVSVGADVNSVYAGDIFKIGSNIYVVNVEKRTATDYIVIWDVDTAPFTEKDTYLVGDTIEQMYKGVVSGSIYYTMLFDIDSATAVILIYDNTGPDLTVGAFLDTSNASPNTSQWGISFDDNDLLYFIANQDLDGLNHLYTYSITGNSYTEYSEYNIALMLDRNNVGTAPNEFEKAFDAAKDGDNNSRIWEIKPKKGGLIQLQTINYNGNIVAITDNFMIVVDKMYEYTDILATNTIAEGKVKKGIFPILEKGRFNCHPDDAHFFSNDDTLKVYDEVDEMALFAMITDKSQDENGIYQFGLDAYNNELWRRTYTKSHSANKTSDKQKDNIDNVCGFCHRDSSIVATTTNYSYEQDRPSMAIFSLGRFMERQVGRASPNGLVTTEAYDGLTKAPQYYPASYNFRDDDIGSEPSGWTSNNGANCTTTVIASLYGHKKVLELFDNNAGDACRISKDFDATSITGRVELWVATTDATKELNILILSSDPLQAINFKIEFDRYFEFSGGAYNLIGVLVPLDNTLIHLRFDFDCVADTYDLYIDGSKELTGKAFRNVVTEIETIEISTEVGNSAYSCYADALGISWDANYNVGDNVVAWDVEINGNLDLINIRRDIPSYYVKKLGITRATCVGGVGVSQTYNDATLEDGKAILPLKEYRDLKIEQNVEALQLATNLFNMFSAETKFIGIRVVNQEYVQPGKTVNFANTGDVTIDESDYLVLFYTYDFINDVYELMILTDDVVLLREFESYFDRSELMVHQNSTAVRDNSRFTKEGGIFAKLTNKTGVPSVKGSLIRPDTVVDNAFILTAADDDECCGVVYEDGIADGDECKIVFSGRAQILLKDATASTAGNWVKTADVAGRADATGASPAAAPQHFQEIGHCLEAKGADTDVLAFIMLHFL